MLKNTFFSLFLFTSSSLFLNAQVSESCDCTIDTLGYASFLQTITPDENATFQFHVSGTFAVAYGLIGSTTPSVVQDLINNHPAVTTIIMHTGPGSENDDANLEASMLIYNHGYKMYLPDNGFIASGAVDMFLAGSIRVVDATYDPVGVHSWSDGVNDATYYPVGHVYHQPYIDYYMNIGFTQQESEDFYYYTINAAPAAGVYWMTDAEIDQYKIRTCRYSANPNYSVSNNNGVLIADVNNSLYQWLDCNDNNSIIIGATNQSFTPEVNGSYAVQITETGCMDTSACQVINTVGIIQHNDKSFLKIYPNPNNGIFQIDFDKKFPSLDVSIVDVSGEVIYHSIQKNCNSLKINSAIENGVYFVSIKTNEAIYSKILLIN